MTMPLKSSPEQRQRIRQFVINAQPAHSLAKGTIEPTDVLRWVNALMAFIPNAGQLQIPQGSVAPEDLKTRLDATIDVLQRLFGKYPTEQDIDDAVDVLSEPESGTRALSLPLRNRGAQQRKEDFQRTLRARSFAGG